MTAPPEVFIRFSESVVAVEATVGEVLEATQAMFRLMLWGEDRAPAAVVERFSVEAKNGRYRLQRSQRFSDRHAFPHEAADLLELLRLLKCHVLQAFIDRHPEHLWLHAGAAVSDEQAVLVAGTWGAGKSSLVAHLCEADWTYLSDDVVPLHVPLALAAPFPLELAVREPSSVSLPRAHVSQLPKQRVELAAAVVAPSEVPVTAVVFPQFDAEASGAEAARLNPGEATLALLRCLFNIGDHDSAAVPHLGALLERAPAYVVRYADPKRAAALVERLLDGTAEVGASVSLAEIGEAEPVDRWLRVMQGGKDTVTPGIRSRPEPSAPPTAVSHVTWKPWAWEVGERKLTVGMAVYDDYDGAYFTLQALRLYHPEVADEVEFVIVDNNPDGPCGDALRRLCGPATHCRYVPNRTWRGTASRDIIFREARTPFVVCMDAHVLLFPSALRQLIDYLDAHPGTLDLLQGPLLHDDFSFATHFDPVWREGMYGTWGSDERGEDPKGEPFEIPMQGLGVFACRRKAWPGFNPRFSGFGGEEGYIHEKIRQRGGRTLCLPFLRWMHRFERPLGVRYPLAWEDRIRNYILGFKELGLDTAPIAEHFVEVLGEEPALRELAVAEAAANHPLSRFDALYGVNSGGTTERWQSLLEQLEPIGLTHRLRKPTSVALSAGGEVGRVLSVRHIVAEAARHDLDHVLILEAPFPETATHDSPSIAALALHHSAYKQILHDLPDDEAGVETWVDWHASLTHYVAGLAYCAAVPHINHLLSARWGSEEADHVLRALRPTLESPAPLDVQSVSGNGWQ